MLYLAVILVVLALALLWQAGRRQKEIGLPAGRVIYSDTRHWSPVESSLYDPGLGLAGRPDYLVEKGGKIMPVEVKSSRITDAPYDSHIFQLAAYCLLIERTLDKRPPYGILHYPNRTFAIDYTLQMETALLETLEEMRSLERRKNIPRSHDSAAHCNACGYRDICDQRIMA